MAFACLPIEVNANIASFLDSDSDLCAFSLICHETHDAVNCDASSIWRDMFVKHFDLVPNVNNNALRRAYQFRRKILRRGANFRQGTTKPEQNCLQVLKDLVLESFSNGRLEFDAAHRPVSRNMEAVKQFAYCFDITQAFGIMPLSARNKSLSMVVMQIMLAHMQFDPKITSPTFGFPDSQKAMYATAQKAPIFTGPRKNEVNLQWVAHAINFFKYHITRPEEQTLYPYYKVLAAENRIKGWSKPLDSDTQLLGRKWKGVYSYLELANIFKFREVPDDEDDVEEDIFNNIESGDTPFQTLQLAFSKPKAKKAWPALFEHHLQSLSVPFPASSSLPSKSLSMPTLRTRAQFRSVPTTMSTLKHHAQAEDHSNHTSTRTHFYASGMDEEKFYAVGWLSTLPVQQGIPGMQRWTMMKYFVTGDDDENEAERDAGADPFGMKGVAALDTSSVDETSLWAYEGVVLPGGELVVGRWWSPRPRSDPNFEQIDNHDNMYSGPFMFWCVDEDVGGS